MIRGKTYLVEQRPVELKIIPIHKDVLIHTLEGDVMGHVGEFLVTGISGEQWPISETIFKQKYISTETPDVFLKRPIQATAYRLSQQKTWFHNGIEMHAEPGDWIIKQRK